MPYISEEDVSQGEDVEQTKFPLKYFDDGHIQIGESGDLSTFHLNLLVIRVVNLDALLPEILVFQQVRKCSFLSFKVLGVAIKTKTFQKELHDTINVNEKIVVNLKSSKEILREFFRTQNIVISFICGTEKLGVTSQELDDIFTLKESKCFFKFPSPNGIVPFNSTDKSPYIYIQTWIEEDMLQEDDESNMAKWKPRTIYSNVMKQFTPPLDQTKVKIISNTEEAQSQGDVRKTFITKSVEKVFKDIPISPKDPMDVYRKYVLNISLKYLYWKIPPPDSVIMFKFIHPKAASCITIFTEINGRVGEEIPLNNLCIKMGYISISAKIQKLLNIWPPRIVLADEKDRCFSEEQEFSVNCSKDYNIEYEIILKGIRTLEPLAKIGIEVSMKECDVENCDEYEHLYLLPIVLDEFISVREISDLEAWKAQEHGRFQKELTDVKEAEIKKLQVEWNEKKTSLEKKLHKTIEKCHELQTNLRNRLNEMKTEKSLQRQSKICNTYGDIFRQNWMKYSDNNTKEVIELLSKIQRDNEALRGIINKQREKIYKMEKSALTKCQTTSLLKELKVLDQKFEEVQKAKSYFKDQWRQAVEEIHQLRTEEIKNMQLQLKRSRKELSQISLDEYGTKEREDPNDEGLDTARSCNKQFFVNK